MASSKQFIEKRNNHELPPPTEIKEPRHEEIVLEAEAKDELLEDAINLFGDDAIIVED